VRFSVGARLTFFDLGAFGAEWRNDVIVGSEYGIASEYYRPLDRPGHFFVAPRLFANTTPFDLYDGDGNVIVTDFGIGRRTALELAKHGTVGAVAIDRHGRIAAARQKAGKQVAVQDDRGGKAKGPAEPVGADGLEVGPVEAVAGGEVVGDRVAERFRVIVFNRPALGSRTKYCSNEWKALEKISSACQCIDWLA
jgi:hypothetical protein